MALATNKAQYATTGTPKKLYIFYSQSSLLTMLRYFPYVQLSVICIFIMFAFITFRTSKQSEQNRVWVGMAKETAHQLGTPTSSLLGWIEYLKSQQVEPFVIEEMNKDITRLLKVVDRFSKIGSSNLFVPRNLYEIVNNAVVYFRTRVPKNVELRFNTSVSAPLQALVNEALFEWVVENLSKGTPMPISWRPHGGHWEVIIGYDDMGTDYPYDDVLVLADSGDSWDHYQDGYNTLVASQFYHQWFNGSFTYNQQLAVFDNDPSVDAVS